MPRVELVSNVWHYYHTALALQRLGVLGAYITGPSALDDEAWVQKLGPIFQRLWLERRLEGIDPQRVRRMWVPEVLLKLIERCGGTHPQGVWVQNEIFSRRAAGMIGDCDALHFVQSVGLEAAHKAKRRGARIICDMREEHPEFQGPLLGEDARQLNLNFSPQPASYRQRVSAELDVADFIFCPSAYARRTFIEHGISADKLVVCPYGVDTSACAPRVDDTAAGERAARPFTVLFLGTAGVRKGVHYLLEAFKTAQLRDSRLLLAGHVDPAFRPILRQYAAWFEEVGPVPHSQLHALFARADVFVLPSLADTFGLVVLEAMAAGLPVIVSDNTGAADVVTNAREGFVVPIRNASAIAEKLTFLHEHPEQCASMGAAAKLAAQRANWDNYERICADFYQALFAPLSIAVS